MREQGKFDRLEITQPEDVAATVTSLHTSWRNAGVGDHFVQFYRDEAFLLEAISGFIGTGLRAVEGAIVITTKARRQALEERLESHGVDLSMVRARKQYVPLDAEETLARFMVNGMPDEVLFTHVVGSVVTRMISGGFRVRAFGEMVALLWADGKPEAAMQLEHLWNKLGKTRRFALFCAYRMKHFEGGANAEGFRHICAAHAGFIPVEGLADGLAAGAPAH